MGEIYFMRSTAKIFYGSFRKLSFQKLVKLSLLLLPHPLFAALSFYATVKTFTLARKYFPKTNSTDGIGNAFRHALWTCLIMMYCCKISSPEKSMAFCKTFTNQHEDLFPNEPLETKMDLHNNQVGIALFMEMLKDIHRQFFETSFFIEKLLEKTKTAKILNDNEKYSTADLVYIK